MTTPKPVTRAEREKRLREMLNMSAAVLVYSAPDTSAAILLRAERTVEAVCDLADKDPEITRPMDVLLGLVKP